MSSEPATKASDIRGTQRRLRETVVAGHLADPQTIKASLADPDPNVRAAALTAAWRAALLDTGIIADALGDPSAVVRKRACELVARSSQASKKLPSRAGRQVDDGACVPLLLGALGDRDSSVVEASSWALGELVEAGLSHAGLEAAAARAVVTALSDVARTHPDPLCRESAIASLGAIGDPASFEVVLAALQDKPAIRRRAALSLAAFDDERAEEALRRCLEDRDWQVRQVAEDLLASDQA